MSKLYSLIERLIELNIENKLITKRDSLYLRNRLLAIYQETDYITSSPTSGDLYETLEDLTSIAIQKGLLEDTLSQKDIFSSTLMNLFIPMPSLVEERFWNLYKDSPKEATSYFYKLSRDANYVKVNRIAKNISFSSPSPYGDLDITINLSKPEKDPKDIAKQKTLTSTTYPTCLLCIENEGFSGTSTLPDRANHRMIHLNINEKDWMLQYSPYLYYNEHCILLSQKHEPMALSKKSFYNLLNFAHQFPHYFMGSNADLPIVGGSILAHEHYQGGCYEFPMHRATVVDTFTLAAFPSISCSLLKWPLSYVSISGDSLEEVAECTNYIYEKWKTYSDPEVQILAETNGVRHNTITPVARKKEGKYVMDIVLRNNRTSDEHPLGIFHPHEDVQHIKKENIGLIEVMGLAILPARLKKELETIKAYILGEETQVADYHQIWAQDLKAHYSKDIDVDTYLHNELGKKFTRVLEDAGVYKMTDIGLTHFRKFIQSL